MKKSANPSEAISITKVDSPTYTYEQVADALLEAGVCVFPKPTNDEKFSNRQEHLHVLKTIQILAMRRKQFEDEENSKRAKVIEPLTVLTKGNKELLDEAQAKKKFLNKEIEINRQKLEGLKQKKADQILQHEHELQEIKEKINELNHKQKVSIHCSLSQSNILAEANKSNENISLKKKRKSDVIRSRSKTLLDEIDEDNEIMKRENKENQEKTKTIPNVKPRNANRNPLPKPHSRSARNSLSIEKFDSQTKHRKSLGDSTRTLQNRSSTAEDYETVQKKMLALFQAKRKARKSSVSLISSQIQNIPLNDDKKEKRRSSMSLKDESTKFSHTLTPKSSTFTTKANDDDGDDDDDVNDDVNDVNIPTEQSSEKSDSPQLNENENQNNNNNKNNKNKNKNTAEHPKTTRSRIPKRPRINYTQC